MIFSQWQPDGGYNYFESKSTRHPIGDDLSVDLPSEINGIGVPSQDVGVPLPKDAVFVGTGKEPSGFLTPMSRKGRSTLSGTSASGDKTSMIVVALFVTGVLIVGGLASKNGKR